MLKKLLLIFTIVVISSFNTLISQEKEPKYLDGEYKFISEGINLHDAGKYEEAIAKYNQVLLSNPDNINALYEAAYSYSAINLNKAIEYALKGLEYKSGFLVQFYIILGNCFDDLKDFKNSEKYYKEGISKFPEEQQLYYNLGLAYFRNNNIAESKDCLLKSSELNPNHPTSHFLLSTIFIAEGKQIPAILAMYRYMLTVNPAKITSETYDILDELYLKGVEKNGNNINITFNNDENDDYGAANFFASTFGATLYTDSAITIEDRFSGILGIAESLVSQDLNQLDTEYEKSLVKYFVDVYNKNLCESMICKVFSQSSLDVDTYIKANQEKFNEFLEWDQNYYR